MTGLLRLDATKGHTGESVSCRGCGSKSRKVHTDKGAERQPNFYWRVPDRGIGHIHAGSYAQA